jgi:hypothetical protein
MFLIASASPDENDRIPPNDGCKGGVPRLVWDWAEAFSVASDSCFMYTAGSGSEAPSCVEYLLNSGPKRQYCEHKYAQPLAPCIRTRHPPSPGRYRVKKGSTTHFTTADAIQAAIYADGSVSASFNVCVIAVCGSSRACCSRRRITFTFNISYTEQLCRLHELLQRRLRARHNLRTSWRPLREDRWLGRGYRYGREGGGG